MQWCNVYVGNARSRITGIRGELRQLLSHELSFQSGEPGHRRWLQPDGSVKTTYWDGFTRLLDRKGTFPSGLIPRTLRLLKKWGAGVNVHDERAKPIEGIPLWKSPEGLVLRDYQRHAVEQAERVGRGVIASPPRTGKTIMMAELVRRIAERTVITAPTSPIAEQTHAKLVELFGGQDWTGQTNDCSSDFFLLTGGQPKTRKAKNALKRATVFVGTADTAVGMDPEWWATIKCWICDERHHQAAKTYRRINDLAVNAYWRWGFTGTDFRSAEGEQVALEACLGRTLVDYSIREMIDRNILVPARCEFIPIDNVRGMRSLKFNKGGYERGVVTCETRNMLIAQAAKRLVDEGRRVLVLVHRIAHGAHLQQLIWGSEFVKGGDATVRSAVKRLDEGSLRCLIGSPVVGEGLDCPAADALVYAKGYKAKVTHTQDTFRVLTAHGAKKDAIIVDIVDRHNETLEEHSIERMKNYLAMGIRVDVTPRAVDNPQRAWQ